MELIVKAAGAALLAILIGLLLKRSNPELSLLLSVCTAALILMAALGISNGLRELREAVGRICGDTEIYMGPVMKCLAISLLTRFSSDFCKDASQAAAASALEFAGSVCAFLVATPLLLSVLKMMGGMM